MHDESSWHRYRLLPEYLAPFLDLAAAAGVGTAYAGGGGHPAPDEDGGVTLLCTAPVPDCPVQGAALDAATAGRLLASLAAAGAVFSPLLLGGGVEDVTGDADLALLSAAGGTLLMPGAGVEVEIKTGVPLE